MITTTASTIKKVQAQKQVTHRSWHRITLLVVLFYEAAGCLFGGSLLIAKPDGSLMDMPVDIMHGFFSNFLIPGILLFGLGIVNAFAFISVLRRYKSDWILTGVALGGLFIWFVVEIVILRELHWLHLMWGFPVFLGCVAAIPLITTRNDTVAMGKALLICGIISSLWYIAINMLVPVFYEGYNLSSFTVSEMSAVGAPTRVLWVLLVMPYTLMFAAFGWGVLRVASENHRLRVAGALIIIFSVFNFYWPPMHQREVLAAGGGTLSDSLHIAWAITTLLFMIVIMGSGAAALGKKFRVYTLATWLVFIIFGVLTGMQSPAMEHNLPTPGIGIWERINIGAFMLWVMVFGRTLMTRIG